jgi:hypothetical protein
VQRFGSALNLNVHFHVLFLDGVYVNDDVNSPEFRHVSAPGANERLCRYVSRPPVASEHLALTASGQVRYALKTPYRDGTTHIVLEPLDFMARLAALLLPPAGQGGFGVRAGVSAAGWRCGAACGCPGLPGKACRR